MPFSVREEISRQLQKMQQAGVIQPSKSPWASPVVLVRKKDGSHRFCVDFRELNAVTRKDTFPLPHVDDLLDPEEVGHASFLIRESPIAAIARLHRPYDEPRMRPYPVQPADSAFSAFHCFSLLRKAYTPLFVLC